MTTSRNNARDGERINAIPTRYRGTRFRSALEARWACVFDQLGWSWDYETLELGDGKEGTGYIADFVVHTKLCAGPDRPAVGPVLVEVRPHIESKEYRETITRIAKSGWTKAAVVLGATVRKREFWVDKPEWWCGYGHPKVSAYHAEIVSNEWFQIGVHQEAQSKSPIFAFGGEFNLSAMWAEGGNRTRWKSNR